MRVSTNFKDVFFKWLPQGKKYYFSYGNCFPYWYLFLLVLSSSFMISFPRHVEAENPDLPPLKQSLTDCFNLFHHGAFGKASSCFAQEIQLYNVEQHPNLLSEILIYSSQAYQNLGQYCKAIDSLNEALTLAKKSNNHKQVASALGELGSVYTALGSLKDASQHLNTSLLLAEKIGDNKLLSMALNNWGNFLASQNQYEDAFNAYIKSEATASQVDNESLSTQALANAARVSIFKKRPKIAKALLDKALKKVLNQNDSYQKAYGLINIGLSYNDLRAHSPKLSDHFLILASNAFNDAINVADKINDHRALSYARGYLGRLYEAENRHVEALQLTQQAVFAAQQVVAQESLYLWHWQTGRLRKKMQETDEAIAAYRRAIKTLQSIRQELTKGHGRFQTSFRESAGSVYLEFVDLLLKSTANSDLQGSKIIKELRLESLQNIEFFKEAELQNYFQDDCITVEQDKVKNVIQSLEEFSQNTAIVYPISLQDRIELLVKIPGEELYQHHPPVPIGKKYLTKVVGDFRKKLQDPGHWRGDRIYGKQLYNWLVRPFKEKLPPSIDTLVFVPDGSLLTIPMAPLYDHENGEFLIQQYAVAITPGLRLIDPQPLKRKRKKLDMLIAGLSVGIGEYPALSGADTERQTLKKLYPSASDKLFNENFLIQNFLNEMQNREFSIVHIISHAQFKGNKDDTFIVTHDEEKNLTLDQLEKSIQLFRFRNNPLELLVLSACETTKGDERAALGLAGVAIKAGARSALASLWQIHDQVTAELVAAFYKQLQSSNTSKAIALQVAQLKFIESEKDVPPAEWAPFLLINNWL